MARQKTGKNFFFGKVLDQYPDEVSRRNRENLKMLSLLGIIIMPFSLAIGWSMRGVFQSNAELLIMLAYFIIMYLVMRFSVVPENWVLTAFYLWMSPVMITGIFMGTFRDPRELSVTIMVFLCVVPVFILDKPWRIISFILISSGIYAVCCYYAKPPQVFAADMVDLVLVCALSIGSNCFILRDRIDNVESTMKLRLMAETDALTKLHNRGAGVEKVSFLLQQGKFGMFVLIDCDDFKNVNDSYGHENGDAALKAIAICLKESFRDEDVVMRFGGDEFAVFAQNLKSPEDRKKCIGRMMKMIDGLSFPDMPGYHITISAGMSVVDSKTRKSFETLYHESDLALYSAKKNGKHFCSFFEESK